MLGNECRFGLLDLFPTLRKTLHNLSRNASQIEPENVPFLIQNRDQIIPQFAALTRQRIVINLARIPDRFAHFQSLQCLVLTARIGHIADHIVRMQLGIQSPACVVHELRINQLSCVLMIVGPDVFTMPDPDRRKSFQFAHSLPDSRLMSGSQTLVEQCHHRHGFGCRNLKIEEPRTTRNLLRSKVVPGRRINVPLKQTEHGTGDFLTRQTEFFRQGTAPETDHFFVFGIIIIARQMIGVK